jgi:hypothetical protein
VTVDVDRQVQCPPMNGQLAYIIYRVCGLL